MGNHEKTKKSILKKWWFWILIVFLIIFIYPTDTSNKNETTTNQSSMDTIKYTITGEDIGEYGKIITLNANTDLPVKKYLYKLPAGTYTVTTTDKKYSTFWIVKDEIVNTGTEEYPEELEYVSEQYMLTASNDTLNGKAKKNLEITINEDESILPIEKSILILEKK